MPAQVTYTLVADDHAIRCLLCGRISTNQRDVEERYCESCHVFHELDVLDFPRACIAAAMLRDWLCRHGHPG